MTDIDTPKLRVIDPHIHLCRMSSGLYPHFADQKPGMPFAQTYTLEAFIAEAADEIDLVGAVHVEAFPIDPVRETKIIQEIADDSLFPIMMVGNADLTADNLAAVIDGHMAHSIFRGVRQVVNIHQNPAYTKAPKDLLNEPRFVQGLQHLGEREVSFDMQLLGHQMARAAEVAGECPNTQIIINHTGLWTDRTLEGWGVYKEGLRALAAHPNVAIKISGTGMRDPKWTVESLRPILYEVLEAFGIERAMFASNFPVDKTWSSYKRIWKSFADCTADLSVVERHRLFADNAAQYYKMNATGEGAAVKRTRQLVEMEH